MYIDILYSSISNTHDWMISIICTKNKPNSSCNKIIKYIIKLLKVVNPWYLVDLIHINDIIIYKILSVDKFVILNKCVSYNS